MLEAFAATEAAVPTRMVCIGTNYGFVPGLFFPKGSGRDYALSPLLKSVAAHQSDFTVFSNLDHGVNAAGGHGGVHAFLSGVLTSTAPSMEHANVSVDQVAAVAVGQQTRYPSMQFATDNDGGNHLSWSTSGVSLQPQFRVQNIFNSLFLATPTRMRKQLHHRLDARRSMLDLVRSDAKRLERRVGTEDREKLDQYFTSVREVERKLQQSKSWVDQPKPETGYKLPNGADSLDLVDRMPIYYDLIKLAIQTDSTRVVTLGVNGIGRNLGGLPITRGYHQLTHHGKVESYVEELSVIEQFHMAQFNRFLNSLKEVKEANGKTLFENTMTLLGSGMGNASSHSNRKLPLLLAGGGFKHGQHLEFAARKSGKRETPAANLLLSMLQQFGVETDQFNLATGTLTGLESA
jgi:hypothetical protein